MSNTPPRRHLGVRAAMATAACVLLALAGCAAQQSDQQAAGDSTLKVGMSVAPTTLDPASFCALHDAALIKQLYVQVMQHGTKEGPNGTEFDPTVAEPYLAQSYDVSDDGKTYTFHLNDGWTFPSGEPLDAAAVEYSLERVNTIAGCASAMINDLYLDPYLIKDVEVVDDLTVDVHLTRPDNSFPLAMATGAASIVDKSVVEDNGGIEKGKPNDWMSSNSAGGGPFLLESYEPGVKAVLKRNESFGGEPAASGSIEINWIKSDSSLLLQTKEGQLDVAIGMSKQSAHSFEEDDSKKVIAGSAAMNMQLLTPMDVEPWKDQKVREAVTYAIPYQDILDNTLYGYGELYYGPIPPTVRGFDKEASAPRTHDMEKAKKLIAESSLEEGTEVTLDILSGDAAQKSIATTIQDSLGQLGITVNIAELSESAWGEQIYGGKTQAALRLDGPGVFNAGYYLQYDEDCRAVKTFNNGRVCVPENTELLDKARSTQSLDDSDKLYSELSKNWVEASPKTILYLDKTAAVVGKDVTYHWDVFTDMRTWSK